MERITPKDILTEFTGPMMGLIGEFDTELFGSNSYSKFCNIHSSLKSNTGDHNCLGCNLNDIIKYIKNQLLQSINNEYLEHLYFQNITTLYLAVERMDTIFNVIKLNDEYRKKHFKGFARVRKWANFIKHPKAFMLCHHPAFTFKGCSYNSKLRKGYNVIIDEPFIMKYYSNDEKNEQLFKELQNKELVLVIFPNMEKVVRQFIQECKRFIEIVETNSVYKEILMERSTFISYYQTKEN